MQAHYRTGILARYTVGETTYQAETSTRPGYHVANLYHGFVDPRSLATYATPQEAIDEVERRAMVAMRREGVGMCGCPNGHAYHHNESDDGTCPICGSEYPVNE